MNIHEITPEELGNIGVGIITYIKQEEVYMNDKLQQAFLVRSADGTPQVACISYEDAYNICLQNNLTPQPIN